MNADNCATGAPLPNDDGVTSLPWGTLPPLLTKRQTAKFYHVNERTIDRWLKDQTLPANAKFVRGGRVYFRTQVLMEDIESDTNAGGGNHE